MTASLHDDFLADELRPADGHVCAALDHYERQHIDCAGCGSALLITASDAEGGYEFAADTSAGYCAECNDPFCKAELSDQTPSGRTLCPDCRSIEVNAALDADEIFATLWRAKSELKDYLARLRREADPRRVRESIKGVHEIDDVMAEISTELFGAARRLKLTPGEAA